MRLEHLFDKLTDHANSDIYPFHMPGHKRNACGYLADVMYRQDVTEIDGFDNLHQPETIIKELQDKASKIYGAETSYYLVNGSTAGILSAVSAALPRGGHLLMTRTCHKSAYHAAYLRGLKITYLYPEWYEDYGFCDAVSVEQIKEALDNNSQIGAVLVVSPTYEGRIADIKAIADEVHKRKIPLVVDEAHGAHLGLSDITMPNSCQLGADVVIHSVHKTLPALTQTALLHVNGNLVSKEKIQRFLHIYQSSSPSYLLMASIDNALSYVEENKEELFQTFYQRYNKMMNDLSQCQCLSFVSQDRERQDLGKLVISVKNTSLKGKDLYRLLLEKYHLQLEMAGESYVLAMFTVNDREEGYKRLTEALLEIDKELCKEHNKSSCKGYDKNPCKEYDEKSDTERGEPLDIQVFNSSPNCRIAELLEAWDAEQEYTELEHSVGRYAGDFINLYPPGIPLLAPGELITEEFVGIIERYLRQGLTVQGIEINPKPDTEVIAEKKAERAIVQNPERTIEKDMESIVATNAETRAKKYAEMTSGEDFDRDIQNKNKSFWVRVLK